MLGNEHCTVPRTQYSKTILQRGAYAYLEVVLLKLVAEQRGRVLHRHLDHQVAVHDLF